MGVTSAVMTGIAEMNHRGTCAGANGTMTAMASAGRVHMRTIYALERGRPLEESVSSI